MHPLHVTVCCIYGFKQICANVILDVITRWVNYNFMKRHLVISLKTTRTWNDYPTMDPMTQDGAHLDDYIRRM